ncbi:type II toxin-antitoxin system VapC family toxin [bacterium]|nr:type II toxin-antitoxin system VapC family toxin [bacterium]
MKYMLDTNICIYIINKKPVIVLERMQTHNIGEICISTITLSELEYGVQKSSNPGRNKLALLEFIAPIEVLPYNEKCAREYGLIRAKLEKAGSSIGAMDLLIAAHALSLKHVLITNNTREYSRVTGLKVENWIS